MLSPSSSISNLPNKNKKFKPDDISSEASTGVKLSNGDGAYLSTKSVKNTELNDVVNNENSENINLNGEIMNGSFKHDVEMDLIDKSSLRDEVIIDKSNEGNIFFFFYYF